MKDMTKGKLIIAPAIVFLLLSFIGCQSSLNKEELEKYVLNEENGILKKQEVPPFVFQANYRPSSLIALQSIDSVTDKNSSEYKALLRNYDNYLYFNLSMSANGVDLLRALPRNRSQFSQYVNTLAFGMRDYVYLTTDKSDTLQFIESNFARMYGMSPTTNVLLIFKRDSVKLNTEEINLEIKDFGTGVGNINFRFKLDEISHIPKLKY